MCVQRELILFVLFQYSLGNFLFFKKKNSILKMHVMVPVSRVGFASHAPGKLFSNLDLHQNYWESLRQEGQVSAFCTHFSVESEDQ